MLVPGLAQEFHSNNKKDDDFRGALGFNNYRFEQYHFITITVRIHKIVSFI